METTEIYYKSLKQMIFFALHSLNVNPKNLLIVVESIIKEGTP